MEKAAQQAMEEKYKAVETAREEAVKALEAAERQHAAVEEKYKAAETARGENKKMAANAAANATNVTNAAISSKTVDTLDASAFIYLIVILALVTALVITAGLRYYKKCSRAKAVPVAALPRAKAVAVAQPVGGAQIAPVAVPVAYLA